jgi:uncharacterized membrane protein
MFKMLEAITKVCPNKILSAGDSNQRIMLATCSVALAALVPVALYQTGVISHLPDPPCSVFDSDRITQSKAAYPFGIPDALLGLASFSVTLALIVASRNNVKARKLLGAKLAIDAGAAAFNATRQIISYGKLCSWCMGTAISAGVTTYAGRHVVAESFAGAQHFVKEEV